LERITSNETPEESPGLAREKIFGQNGKSAGRLCVKRLKMCFFIGRVPPWQEFRSEEQAMRSKCSNHHIKCIKMFTPCFSAKI
jgi:hypothetical protein